MPSLRQTMTERGVTKDRAVGHKANMPTVGAVEKRRVILIRGIR